MRLELGQKILSRHNENVYIIGTCSIDILPMIAKNGVENIYEQAVGEYRTLHENLTWPYQLWRREA